MTMRKLRYAVGIEEIPCCPLWRYAEVRCYSVIGLPVWEVTTYWIHDDYDNIKTISDEFVHSNLSKEEVKELLKAIFGNGEVEVRGGWCEAH